MAAASTAVVAEVADVGGGDRRTAPRSGGSTSSRLRAGAMRRACRGSSRPKRSARARPSARSATTGSSRVHDQRRVVGESVERIAPTLGDELELAVAVELVAEEVAECDDARSRAGDRLGQRRLVHLEQSEIASPAPSERRCDPGEQVRAGPVPREASLAPRISAAIAVVVVLPFVAETSATPCGRRRASASTAPGSSFHSSFPGSVVPPPRPAARESHRPPARRSSRG